MLSVAAVIGLVIVGILVLMMPSIFTLMPLTLVGDARVSLLLVGGSLALGLPFNATNAIFIGLQRNHIPAKIAIVSKTVLALMLILTVTRGGQLTALAVAFASTNVLTYVWQWYVYKRAAGFVEISCRFFGLSAVRELVAYCTSLTVWNVAMLMISGLDSTIVGIFDFRAVAFFTVSASLITFIIGFQNAIISPLIPAGAALSASGTPEQVGRILVKSTRLCSLTLLLTGVPVALFAEKILSAWVGKSYAIGGAGILQALVAGNIIRYTAAPYAMLLIATGRQRAVLLTPVIEGVVNIAASIALAWFLGAVGVALGTMIGSVAGVLGNWFLNMSRTQDMIAFEFSEYLLQGVLKPLLCFLPVIFYVISGQFVSVGWHNSIPVMAVMGVSVLVTVMFYGLDTDERKVMLVKIRLTSS
jgi:O-antigen/teichoic acid export membrane protein